MLMLDTIGLLEETPHNALVSLINHHNVLEIDPNDIEFSYVSSIGHRKTRVLITPKRRVNPFILDQYKHLSEFYYNRLDLTTFFSNQTLNLNITLPASTHVVLKEIKEQLGFILEESEFILEEITPLNVTPYRLKAKEDSLRWVGYVDIDVVEKEFLNDVIEVTELNELWDPSDVGKRFVGMDQPTVDGLRFGGHLGSVENDWDINYLKIHKLLPGLSSDINLNDVTLIYNNFAFNYPANQYSVLSTRTLAFSLNDQLNDDYIGRVVVNYNLNFIEEVSPYPKEYKKPIELFSPELSAVILGDEIIKLKTGDLLTDTTDEWVIGRYVFNNEPWVVEEEPSNYNAYNSKVIYNGFNSTYRKPFNPLLTHILVLELGEECLNYSGTCYIYYNLSMVS